MASSADNLGFNEYHDTMSILLVGRDGNGQTSCKTSIENVSNEIEVVHIAGLGDTGSDRLHEIKTVRNNVQRIMEDFDSRSGFNAICLVLKYGVRFTKQEKDAVEDVKAMLGEDVFRKHGIVLMTYGDLFEMNKEEDGRRFMDWCREQTGEIQNLFAEVNYRIVLFNNRTDSLDIKRKQFDELMSLVGNMRNSFGLNEFKAAQKIWLTITITCNSLRHSGSNSSTEFGHAFNRLLRPCVYFSIIGLLVFIICILTKVIRFP